jgi:hypothetical protein
LNSIDSWFNLSAKYLHVFFALFAFCQSLSCPFLSIRKKGSITGAYSPLQINGSVTPSFVLLAVQANKLICYVYELINDAVEVSKTEFIKPQLEASSAILESLLK